MLGASAFLKSVNFRAFAANVKTIVPTQKLYQSGHPIWWYDLPQVMYSFFDEYDFSGKPIIPFDVHRGSRLSGTPDTIQELEPDAAVISDGFAVVHETAAESVSDVAADVEEWLGIARYNTGIQTKIPGKGRQPETLPPHVGKRNIYPSTP